jgi:tetratricopeptide (TPR) repeat protein
MQNTTHLYRIRPARQCDAPALNSAVRTYELDASFAHYGVWAGVSNLVEQAYQHYAAQGRQDVLDEHNYALYMMLPQHRDTIGLKYACLTDTASNTEKTRNFPLDRAYRLVNGAVALIGQWKADVAPAEQWALLVRRFGEAGHLAARFYTELARRLSISGRIAVCLEGATQEAAALPWAAVTPEPGFLPMTRITPQDEALPVTEGLTYEDFYDAGMAEWERLYIPLLRYYRDRHDGLNAARVAMRALCVHNHYGFYYESSSFVDTVLPWLDKLVGDDQAARWDYIGNIFQGLVTTGQERRALEVVEKYALPYLTENVLQAKLHYLLAMVHLRYLKEQDVPLSHRHIEQALHCLQMAEGEIPDAMFAFLHVFINNGLAFVRVRQGRPEDALMLCQQGFIFLTDMLGDDVHRLHRSVLLYNSAQVLSALGQQEDALHYYYRAMEMDPFYSEYYNESGNILQRLGRYDEALAMYSLAARYSAPYAEVYFNKGNCHAQLEQWEAACTCLRTSLELNPQQPEAHLLLGEALDMLDRPAEAQAAYSAAIELDNQHVPARVNRAVLRYAHGDLAAALTDMDRVLELEPTVASHYANRAEIYKALQLRDINAMRQYQEAA